MGIFSYLFLALWAVYAYYIVNYVKGQIISFKKLAAKEDPAVAEKYDALRRKDSHKWNELEMYFCAIFLLPIRLITFITTIVLGGLILKIVLIGVKDKNKPDPSRRQLFTTIIRACSRICMFAMGFFYVNRKKVNISDIDPSYPKEQKSDLKAPIQVSNHASWLDIFVHVASENVPGFMAKQAVASYPIIGEVGRGLQCLFVKRESKDARDGIMADLKERIARYAAHPETSAQVLIFPEGTTSNGESLLSFKKGAFCNLTPVYVTGIKYHGTRFCPAYDTIGGGRGLLFLLLQITNGITVYDMGVYDPSHLNLKGEEDWEVYARKVKDIMAKALDMKQSELGYHDTSIYWDLFYGTKPKTKAE